MTPRLVLTLACALAALSVALGAFGAHALRARVSADLLGVWQTAVHYHALHSLALFGVGLFMLHRPEAAGSAASAWLFVAGIVLFSGSLYVLVLGGVRVLGAVTPFGGAAFIAGWIALGYACWRGFAS